MIGRTGIPALSFGEADLALDQAFGAVVKPKRRPRRTLTEHIAMLCEPCHNTVHVHLSEHELEATYNTLEDLARQPEIAKFVSWVAKQSSNRRVAVKKPRY